MKLAYLTNQYPSISHSFIRREIEALERRGCAVTRYSVRKSEHGDLSEEDRREAAKTTTIIDAGAASLVEAMLSSVFARPLSSVAAILTAIAIGWRSDAGLLRHFFYAGEALALATWLRRDGLTHVHAHFGTNSATVAMFASRVNASTFSFTVHGPEEFDKPAAISLPRKIKAAAFVAAVSSFGESQLRRLVEPSFWDRLRIIPCGVEKTFYDGPIGPPDTPAKFVCVGRLSEQKGQLTLIEAAAAVKQRGGDFTLALVGDGEMRGAIEAAIARHGLGDCVTLVGWKSPAEVRREIEQARAFVLPSYAEGLPVSIMEAMTLERPVISTYVAGIPELVIPGLTGWLAPAADAAALADAMMAAINATPQVLDAMGKAGKERVLARHDIDKIAATLEQAFDEVLSRGAPR